MKKLLLLAVFTLLSTTSIYGKTDTYNCWETKNKVWYVVSSVNKATTVIRYTNTSAGRPKWVVTVGHPSVGFNETPVERPNFLAYKGQTKIAIYNMAAEGMRKYFKIQYSLYPNDFNYLFACKYESR